MIKFFKSLTSSLWKPDNFYTLEYLSYLHDIFRGIKIITDANKNLIIEALRVLSEVLLWGDQHDPKMVEFFIEREMCQHFTFIMKQKCCPSVHIQLLQTLNIIYGNVTNEDARYALLKNNTVNSIIRHRFDFLNEDIMAYFVYFLKTLSLRLNEENVHFFFDEVSAEFPLFTVPLKHFFNQEPMIRKAIRAIMLKIYSIENRAVQNFVLQHSKAFFPELMKHILDKFAILESYKRQNHHRKIYDLTEELINYMVYFGDIFDLKCESLKAFLHDCLNFLVIEPLFARSLTEPDKYYAIIRHAFNQ